MIAFLTIIALVTILVLVFVLVIAIGVRHDITQHYDQEIPHVLREEVDKLKAKTNKKSKKQNKK